MSFQSKHTYPAFVYENDKNYYADCLELNLVTTGDSPITAVENLENEVSKIMKGKKFSLNPIFGRS